MAEYVNSKYKVLRELLLSSGGEITEEIKQEVDRLTTGEEIQSYNNLLSLTSQNLTSEDILAKISKIPLPKVFLNAVERTLNTSLAPIKINFMKEIENYVPVLSKNNVRTTRKIKRTVKKSSIRKLQNGKFVDAFSNSGNEKVINPEFKQLLMSGYKPRDIAEYDAALKRKRPDIFENPPQLPDSSDPFTEFMIGIENPRIGTPESDFLKNYVGGDQPSDREEEVPYTISKQGGLLIDSYTLKDEEVDVSINNSILTISLTGTMRAEQPVETALNSVFFDNLPSWGIKYAETKDRYFLNIKNNLVYYPLTISRPTAETSSYRFSGRLSQPSDQEIYDAIQTDECDYQLKDDLFASFFNLNGIVETRRTESQRPRNNNLYAEEKNVFKTYMNDNYKKALDSTVRQSFKQLNNNRLLKSFSPSYEVGPENLNFIVLGMINFIPKPNQELIDCNKNPHPLNMDEVSELMSKKFNDVGVSVVPTESVDFKKDEKSPTVESLKIAAAYLMIRIFVLEYVLKNLIVFDELGYSSSINNSITKEYVSILAKKELDQIGAYKKIEKIIIENYDFLLSNNIIKQEDEDIHEDDFNSVVDNGIFEKPSKKFKTFTTAILRKVVGYMKNLIGVTEDVPKGDLLISSVLHDVVTIRNTDIGSGRDGYDKNRLIDFKDFEQFFIFEKYVNGSNFKDNFWRSSNNTNTSPYQIAINKQASLGGSNITTFIEYSEFLHKVIRFKENFSDNTYSNIQNLDIKNHLIQNNGMIKERYILRQVMQAPSIGIRLNYMMKQERINYPNTEGFTKEQQIQAARDQLKQRENFISSNSQKFYIKKNRQQSVSIYKKDIKSKRQYCNFELDNDGVTFYNSLPIVNYDIQISLDDIFRINENITNLTVEQIHERIKQVFENKKQQILSNLQQTSRYKIMINTIMGMDKISGLMSVYSTSALSNVGMERLFEKTKKSLNQLLVTCENLTDYEYISPEEKTGYDKLYLKDLENVGNPDAGPDILKMVLRSSVLILKGLLKVTDPNMSIAFLIQDLAATGLLLPKLDEEGRVVGYPGDKILLPSIVPSLAQLPITIFPPPPVGIGFGPPITLPYGPIFWGLEAILWEFPFFKELLNNSQEAKDLLSEQGLDHGMNFTCSKNQDDN